MKHLPTPANSVAAWTLIAQAVIRGEYRKATATERESICMGLRATGTKECLRALDILDKQTK